MNLNSSSGSSIISPRLAQPPFLNATGKIPSISNAAAQAPSISLYTSVVRMSLNALQHLSPVSDIASLNVRRLHELMLSQEKVSPYTTPVDDWLLAGVLHITISLQRVVTSLYPVFLKLGLENPLLNIPIMGLEYVREKYDEAAENDELNLIATESNEEIMAKLDLLFDSPKGISLIQYTKDCMQLLVSAVNSRRALLEKAIEPRVCAALMSFVDKISIDADCPSPAARAVRTRVKSSTPDYIAGKTIGSNSGIPGGIAHPESCIVRTSDSSRKDTGSAPVRTMKEHSRSPTRPTNSAAPLSRMRSWYMGTISGKESPSHDHTDSDLTGMNNSSKVPQSPYLGTGTYSGMNSGIGSGSGSYSDKDKDMNNDRLDEDEKEHNDAMQDYVRSQLRTESVGSDSDVVSVSSAGSVNQHNNNNNYNYNNNNQNVVDGINRINQKYFSAANSHISREAKDNKNENYNIDDDDDDEEDDNEYDESDENLVRSPLIRWLKLMRDPYLKMNALRSVGVVKSITALEHHESACASAFAEDLNALRNELEEHRDLSKKSAEEMQELREISSTILSSLSAQERARQSSVRSNDNLLLKKTATNWHDCLSVFEKDWSPFADYPNELKRPDYTEKDRKFVDGKGCRIDGVSDYEISELRDSRMRRMILTRAADPVDHRESAYREGKQRGGMNNKDGTFGSQRDHSASFTTQRASFLRLDLSKIRSNGGAAWGDDSDLTEGLGLIDGVNGNNIDEVVTPSDLPSTANGSGREENTGGGLGGSGGMGLIGGLGALVFTSGNAEKRPECSYVYQWAPEEKMQAYFTVNQVPMINYLHSSLGRIYFSFPLCSIYKSNFIVLC